MEADGFSGWRGLRHTRFGVRWQSAAATALWDAPEARGDRTTVREVKARKLVCAGSSGILPAVPGFPPGTSDGDGRAISGISPDGFSARRGLRRSDVSRGTRDTAGATPRATRNTSFVVARAHFFAAACRASYSAQTLATGRWARSSGAGESPKDISRSVGW